jgi:hypothetical protein
MEILEIFDSDSFNIIRIGKDEDGTCWMFIPPDDIEEISDEQYREMKIYSERNKK